MHYAILHKHAIALLKEKTGKRFLTELASSGLSAAVHSDETFLYIENPDTFLFKRRSSSSHHLLHDGAVLPVCGGCMDGVRKDLQDAEWCRSCTFRPMHKESFDLKHVKSTLSSFGFEETTAFDLYHCVYSRSDNGSWSHVQFSKDNEGPITFIEGRSQAGNITFPYWRFSKKKQFLYVAYPYVMTRVLPGTNLHQTVMHPTDTKPFFLNSEHVGKNGKVVMRDALLYLNAFHRRTAIDDTVFPIHFPVGYSDKGIRHSEIREAAPLDLIAIQEKERYVRYDGNIYRSKSKPLDVFLEEAETRTLFPMTEAEEPFLLYDGKVLYDFYCSEEDLHVSATGPEQSPDIRLSKEKQKHTLPYLTIRSALEAHPACTNPPRVFDTVLNGYESGEAKPGDFVLVVSGVGERSKLNGEVGCVAGRGPIPAVSFLNGYIEVPIPRNEFLIYRKGENRY